MWFIVVLIILFILGVYGLVKDCRSLYWQGYFRRGDLHDLEARTYYREDRYARSREEVELLVRENTQIWHKKFRIRYENQVSSLADSLTLILGVVLFYWLLR
jgi:hypothetical protein